MTNQYSELQEFLNKCIEMGWKPRDFYTDIYVSEGGIVYGYEETYSYHDLFSVDSGLMSFVSRGEGDRYTALRQMCALDKEGKIKYFLSNASLPTQD